MSELSMSYLEKVFDTEFPKVELLLHKKLDRLDSLSIENRSDWQFKEMKELEKETMLFISFIDIIGKMKSSYLEETTKVVGCQIQIWVENKQLKIDNQLLKQEIEQKDTIIGGLLIKFSQTIKKILQK